MLATEVVIFAITYIKGTDMIRTALLTITLFCAVFLTSMLQGCGDSSEASAAGTYELDKAAMKTALQAEIDSIEDPMEKMGASIMLDMIDAMSITLTLNQDGTASGVFLMGEDEDRASGNWTLTGSDISIALASEEGDTPETMAGTFNDDTIRLSDPDEDSPFQMIFTRVQR